MSEPNEHEAHAGQRCDVCRPIGTRVSEVLAEIVAEIPERLALNALLRDAHARLVAALESETTADERRLSACERIVTDNLAAVLREAATHLVEEYTSRTGEPFYWNDEPEPPEDDGLGMRFALDEKGNLAFDNRPPEPPRDEA